MKAMEMKLVYMIIALLLLIWALFFFSGLRVTMLSTISKVFG